jgi:hypothetical protein
VRTIFCALAHFFFSGLYHNPIFCTFLFSYGQNQPL